jgi:hypothetical protein
MQRCCIHKLRMRLSTCVFNGMQRCCIHKLRMRLSTCACKLTATHICQSASGASRRVLQCICLGKTYFLMIMVPASDTKLQAMQLQRNRGRALHLRHSTHRLRQRTSGGEEHDPTSPTVSGLEQVHLFLQNAVPPAFDRSRPASGHFQTKGTIAMLTSALHPSVFVLVEGPCDATQGMLSELYHAWCVHIRLCSIEVTVDARPTLKAAASQRPDR